jgi:hypothetical protein
MALADNDLFASRDFAGSIRMVVKMNKVATFASNAGATVLLPGVPVAKNSSSKLWVPYTQPSDAAIYTLTSNGTPATAGTFDLIINGLGIEVAYNATAAQIQSEVNAMLAGAGEDYTVAAVATAEANLGVASAVVTITFSENAGAPVVEVDVDDLTGNAHVLAQSDAGTALNDSNVIRGFIAHDSVTLSATGEVQGVVALAGEIHRDDVNTAAMRALLEGSPSEAELDIALRAIEQSSLDFYVRGLADVA